MSVEFHLSDEMQTRQFGRALAQSHPPKAVVYLSGELGAGKTTLSQAFIQACGYEGRVKSPTYTLLETYTLPDLTIHHLDLYRLSDPEELEFLGIDELDRPDAIMLVEWPEKGEGVLPAADLSLVLHHENSGRRVVAQPHQANIQSWLQDARSHFN